MRSIRMRYHRVLPFAFCLLIVACSATGVKQTSETQSVIPSILQNGQPPWERFPTVEAINSMTVGPDHQLWFLSAHYVGKFSLGSATFAYYNLANQFALTLGSDGNMWACGYGVSKVDLAGNITTVEPLADCAGIVGAVPGRIYFTDFDALTITEITTDGQTVAQIRTPQPPESMCLGSDGNLWFTEGGVYNAIATVDPGLTTIKEYKWTQRQSVLTPLIPGPDGRIYYFTDFSLRLNHAVLHSIDTSGVSRVVKTGAPGGSFLPWGIDQNSVMFTYLLDQQNSIVGEYNVKTHSTTTVGPSPLDRKSVV